MGFVTNRANSLEVLIGAVAIHTDPKGKKWTYHYESTDLVDFPLKGLEAGIIALIRMEPVVSHNGPTSDTSVILDFSTQYVYFRDENGHIMMAPVILHNQGAMFSIVWDSEESDMMDNRGNNDNSRMADFWFNATQADDPAEYVRGVTILRNLHKLV